MNEAAFPPPLPLSDRRPSRSAHREDALPHSGLGVASFVLAVLGGMVMLALFVLVAIADTVTASGLDEDSWLAMLLGIAMIVTLFTLIVALGLGIAGICVSGVKKLFAILGTTFSAVTIILTIVLIVIGLVMEG